MRLVSSGTPTAPASDEPSAMPIVRKIHAAVVHGRVQRAHAASRLPPINAATANENATDSPT